MTGRRTITRDRVDGYWIAEAHGDPWAVAQGTTAAEANEALDAVLDDLRAEAGTG